MLFCFVKTESSVIGFFDEIFLAFGFVGVFFMIINFLTAASLARAFLLWQRMFISEVDVGFESESLSSSL